MYEGLEERGLGTEELRGRVTDSGRIKVVGWGKEALVSKGFQSLGCSGSA